MWVLPNSTIILISSSISSSIKLQSLNVIALDSYSTLNELVREVNEFADFQEYVVIKKRTKINKKSVIRKAILKCDKEENEKTKEYDKRET
jgi:hypothetical protein